MRDQLGEPFGTLVLAVAVTVIEASLILSMMLAGGDHMARCRARAARADRRQTSMNLAIGSALACVGLTIPVVVLAATAFALRLVLGLERKDLALLIVTFLTSAVTLGSGART